jgi:arylsulfatase
MRGKWRLVQGRELYDLRTDPGQKRDVAAEQPTVVAQLRNAYEEWWRGVSPTLDDLSPISIGAEQQNPVTLTAADWANVYCDNMQNLRTGIDRDGQWHVLVERGGSYEIEFRRWPREVDVPMTAGVPPFRGFDPTPPLPAGKAMPIARVRLRIGAIDETKSIAPDDRGVRFTVDLEAGRKLLLQGWFYDGDGRELSGAYYAYVRRK